MPKQKRWFLKRELDYTVNAIERGQEHIISVGKEFQPIHPEYAEACLRLFTALELVKHSVKELRDMI